MQPTTDDPPSVFDRLLAEVRARISGTQFDTWFRRAALSVLTPTELVVAVPNTFHRQWMEKQHAGVVATAAERALGRTVAVRFVVDPGLRLLPPLRDPALGAGPASVGAAPEAPVRPGALAAGAVGSAADPRPFVAPDAPPKLLDGSVHLDPRYTFESFILGPSNQIAYAAARAVADNPSRGTNPLFIYGNVGLGKTHLLQAICHEMLRRRPGYRIVYLSCETFTNQFVSALQRNELDAFRARYRSADMLVVDDIHFLAGKERTAEEFFHTFNALHQHGRQIVVSSDAPPADIPTLTDRMISRFKWGLVERLERPETETRMAILRHKAQAEGLSLPDDVTAYIAESVRDSVREVEGALASVRSRAQIEGVAIDLELARRALDASLSRRRPAIGLDRIVEVVCAHYGVKPGDLKSAKRTKSVSLPRQIVMYVARQVTTLSLEEIGDYFGGRDHTTVLYAVQRVHDFVESTEEVRTTVTSLVDRILAR
jgi:chromosomal replication initiator protein